MRIHDMFEKDIDREINGVIKIGPENDASLKQELSEYVVTRELNRHFTQFYDAYERALDHPTDKIGVWISGFFGSGKSHFLKMLSYLLTNKEVAGQAAIDYFNGKFDDPELFERVSRCAQTPAESILFNIDSKNVGDKDRNALKRTFARVFYDHLGFYGEDLHLARLEKFIDDEGLTEKFRAAYEEVNGESWVDSRESYAFNSDDVIDALEESGAMSREEAERWFERPEDEEFSIDSLTTEIVNYAKKRSTQSNGAFRLLFMVDEVGQYINNGRDVDMMLNLQTIVEELGTKGAGLVWVMVTSQEAIDEVVNIAGISNDFSKIQGRFDTRLSLSSSSADEVIKRRILAKTPAAADLLRMQYGQKASVLRNLFTFQNAVGDLAGYASDQDFIDTFPFAGYQFKVIQKVLAEIRKHGNTGKHLSGGERSMLSGFKEAAQAIEEQDESALVPFWRFYDTVKDFIDSPIHQVFTRAAKAIEQGQGLEAIDLNVLKITFLILHVNDVPTTVDNVAILMADTMDVDIVTLRESVRESLDRLVRQNYVSRTGEIYQFLNDAEQEIARAISHETVDMSRIIKHVGDIVFGSIFEASKLAYHGNNYPVAEYVDEMRMNNTGELILRVMTANSGREETNFQWLTLRSQAGEAICLLSEETTYITTLERAEQIDQYVRTQNPTSLPENQQSIIRAKREEQRALEAEAKNQIEGAIRQGEFYAAGRQIKPQGSSAKQLLESALSNLAESIYSQLKLVDHNYESDADVRAILQGNRKTLDGVQPNSEAIERAFEVIKDRVAKLLPTSMLDIQKLFQAQPYGWRELDIAAVIAELATSHRVRLKRMGVTVGLNDSKAVDYLRKATETPKVSLEIPHTVSDTERTKARDAVAALCRVNDLPQEETFLAERAYAELTKELNSLNELLNVEYRHVSYPGKSDVTNAVKTIKAALGFGEDSTDLLPALAKMQDDLLDTAEDLEDVRNFFPDQQRIWDKALQCLAKMDRERDYIAVDQDAVANLKTIKSVLDASSPFGRIRELPPAMQALENTYTELLKAKREELSQRITEIYDDIAAHAEAQKAALPLIAEQRVARGEIARNSQSLTELDALAQKLEADQSRFYSLIDQQAEKLRRPKPTPASSPAAAPAAAPKPLAEKIRGCSRSTVFKPRTLRNAQDIDSYLNEVRQILLDRLQGNDGIRIN